MQHLHVLITLLYAAASHSKAHEWGFVADVFLDQQGNKECDIKFNTATGFDDDETDVSRN